VEVDKIMKKVNNKKKLVKKMFKSPEVLEQRIAPGVVGGPLVAGGSGSGGCINNHNINNHNINNHNINNHNVNNHNINNTGPGSGSGSGSDICGGSGLGSGSALPPIPPRPVAPPIDISQGWLPG